MDTCPASGAGRPARWLRAVALAIAVGAASLSGAQAPPAPAPSSAKDLESLRQRAQAGDADAQFLLADRLHRGEGVARDDVEARSLVLKAAQQGHLDAQRSLGLYYWRAYGGPQDKVEALKWILIAERGGNRNAANVRANMLKSMTPEEVKEAQVRADANAVSARDKVPSPSAIAAATEGSGKAPPRIDLAKLREEAAKGNPRMQSALGGALLYGRGVEVDEAEGLKWIRAAVAQGDTLGLALLGGAYIEGKGVPRNAAEGIALVRQAADKGLAPAQASLAQYYFRGEAVERDDKAAADWARKAADQGDKDGQRILGALYMGGRGVPKDFDKAEEWLKKSAAQGDELAKVMLPAVANLRNADKSPGAAAASVEFARNAAEAGNAAAQYELSRMYAEGTLVPKDKKLEVDWERKAAEQGHVEAMGAYGLRLVVTRDGVKGDFWKGYSYLYNAGAQGHVQSQRVLGLLFQKGAGVNKDIVMSLIWLDVAVMAGDGRAKELRESVLKEATPEQVAEANRRAEAWMKRSPKERATPQGAP